MTTTTTTQTICVNQIQKNQALATAFFMSLPEDAIMQLNTDGLNNKTIIKFCYIFAQQSQSLIEIELTPFEELVSREVMQAFIQCGVSIYDMGSLFQQVADEMNVELP